MFSLSLLSVILWQLNTRQETILQLCLPFRCLVDSEKTKRPMSFCFLTVQQNGVGDFVYSNLV